VSGWMTWSRQRWSSTLNLDRFAAEAMKQLLEREPDDPTDSQVEDVVFKDDELQFFGRPRDARCGVSGESANGNHQLVRWNVASRLWSRRAWSRDGGAQYTNRDDIKPLNEQYRSIAAVSDRAKRPGRTRHAGKSALKE